jgi:hypothetical protein
VLWQQNILVCNSVVNQRNTQKICTYSSWNRTGKNLLEIQTQQFWVKHQFWRVVCEMLISVSILLNKVSNKLLLLWLLPLPLLLHRWVELDLLSEHPLLLSRPHINFQISAPNLCNVLLTHDTTSTLVYLSFILHFLLVWYKGFSLQDHFLPSSSHVQTI